MATGRGGPDEIRGLGQGDQGPKDMGSGREELFRAAAGWGYGEGKRL